MANTPTVKHGLLKPDKADEDWNIPMNDNWDSLDDMLPATGGATGQILAKTSNGNYDTGWIDPPEGGNGGDGGGITPEVITDAIMTGNIYGGNIWVNDDTTFSVRPFSCVALDNVTQIALNDVYLGTYAQQNGDRPVSFFACKHGDGSVTVESATVSKDPTTLPGTVVAYRWIGMAVGVSDGNRCIEMTMNGDWVFFNDCVTMQLDNYTVDHNSCLDFINYDRWLFDDRIELIKYGVYNKGGGSVGTVIASGSGQDGGVECVIGSAFTSAPVDMYDINGWGDITKPSGGFLPFHLDRYFCTAVDGQTAGISIQAIKMLR